jgi:hypothetical protein
MQMLETLADMSRKLGPYVLLEVLLPGGTLFAFTLFLYRHPAAARSYAERMRRATARALRKVRRSIPTGRSLARSLASLGSGVSAAVRAFG